ncbi:PRTase-like protein [Pisolithus albus]|nr:PRTase-like protein [Pisolithus albus]
MDERPHIHATYNEVHTIIKEAAAKISQSFKPDVLIAIGCGFFPARVLRTFLKDPLTKKNIPIRAIGLSLYEPLVDTSAEKIGTEIIRTQWLGADGIKSLLGRKVLIVDEIDDSRTTLQYALSELQKDIELQLLDLPESEREANRTEFAVFVVHNKSKPKVGILPPNVPYFAGAEVGNVWLEYPWEALDIEEHDRRAAQDRLKSQMPSNP